MNNTLENLLNLPKPVVFDETQQEAITRCCDVTKRVVAVTGGAGTGKTLLLKEIHKQLTDAGYEGVVSAPTGKAAKRILESTGIIAVTNHRLLGYGMPIESAEEQYDGSKKIVRLSAGPKYTRARPLEYDFILGDEYAMVNQEIHTNIVAAMKPRSMLRVFGDVNQLKPIEEVGNKNAPVPLSPFENLLSKFAPVVLNTVHRHQEGSAVASNAQLILKGNVPKKLDGFNILWTDTPVRKLIDYIHEQMELGEAGHNFAGVDAQIITLMNKTWVGTKRLNPAVQQLFWEPNRRGMELQRHKWSEDEKIRIQVGSKVVYTSNTYDLGNGCYALNGEVGIVVELDHDLGVVDIDFGDRVVSIPPLTVIMSSSDSSMREFDPRKNIDLGYALTTHKMQGSEVNHVVYLLNKSMSYSQSRRNFYTAVSRARTSCVVISDQASMMKSVKSLG